MQKLKQVIIILYLIFSITFPVKACTLWAATGKCTENNTTLIVKNRDWKPDNHNELMLIIPEKGYSFLALYSAGGGYEGVKGGINEKGLVIVTATASTIPSEERVEGKGFLIELLRNYESVKAVLENREIFSSGKPGFYMIGDREHIAVIEIGMNGEFAVKEIEDGILYHTNHYTDEKLLKFNKKENESSKIRYNRIKYLLENHANPLKIEDFIDMSQDTHDGPDNSIWRTGSTPKKTRTLGTWIVAIPKNDFPELYIKFANPEEDERIYRFTLDEAFWESGKFKEK